MYFKKIYIILVSLFIFLVALNSISIIYAREIDSKFMDFLLTNQNISGYDIKSQNQGGWLISPDELGDCVRQEWYNDNEIPQLNLTIGIFDSEEEAIRVMLYYTGTTAEPWIWGSVTGGINGLHSWRSFNDENGALFAYGNIGILISRRQAGDKNIIPVFASAQMEKIDQNLSQEIIDHRQTLRQSRISAADYDRCMAEAVNVNLSGYTKITDEDSLWLMKDNGVKMGIRREWQNREDRVIGIDICEVESTAMAFEIASERAKMSNGSVVNELGSIPWQNSRSSQVLVKGNVAIHLYYLNHKASTSEPETPPPYFDPLLPYGSTVPISYLYPFPYSVNYSSLPDISGLYSPNHYSASPFTNISLLYPYAAGIYNPGPAPWGSSSVPFDYSLLKRYNTAAYPYTTNYLESWRYYPFANSIPNYYSGVYPYNLPYNFLRK